MLNAFFGAVVDAAGAEGGFVNQFQGDGALCVFGAPDELPDHALRGLSAAARMRREIARLGDTYPSFDAAIGVSTGRVVAGEVGTKDRHEYTVIGDPVNEAARLCDEAKQRPTRVIASGATISAAGGSGDWLRCGEVDLRGRQQPTVIYEPSSA
jgi:adenylate cyclase